MTGYWDRNGKQDMRRATHHASHVVETRDQAGSIRELKPHAYLGARLCDEGQLAVDAEERGEEAGQGHSETIGESTAEVSWGWGGGAGRGCCACALTLTLACPNRELSSSDSSQTDKAFQHNRREGT